jgi:hypothetical protein
MIYIILIAFASSIIGIIIVYIYFNNLFKTYIHRIEEDIVLAKDMCELKMAKDSLDSLIIIYPKKRWSTEVCSVIVLYEYKFHTLQNQLYFETIINEQR